MPRPQRRPATAHPSRRLRGGVRVGGDKSLAQRALILAAMSIGTSEIRNLPPSGDVRSCVGALRRLGARIAQEGAGARVVGCGVGGFRAPRGAVDCGNSGTSARLLMGAVSPSPHAVRFTGDASLKKRPMARVLAPLAQMGVQAGGRARLALTLSPPPRLLPLCWEMPIASAQVKSALILASLGAAGRSEITEPAPTRDHTERMLPLFGGKVRRAGGAIIINGDQELRGARLELGDDPSSAAFLLVAALLVDDSDVKLARVLHNPHRLGFVRALKSMGARLQLTQRKKLSSEFVCTMRARTSALRALRLSAQDAPACIDEIPILAVAAAFAKGTSRFDGLAELRVKESDRLAALEEGLRANGVRAKASKDSLQVWGQDEVAGGARVRAHGDHRIAMAFLVLGLAARAPVRVDDAAAVATSFPSFFSALRSLGAKINA